MSSNTQNAKKSLDKINLLMNEYINNPSLISLDLIQENTRFFYEQIQLLKDNNTTIIEKQTIKKKDKLVSLEKTVVKVEKKEVNRDENQTIKETNPIKSESQIIDKKKPIAQEGTESRRTKKQIEITTEPKKEKIKKNIQFESKETIADQFISKTSMNDLLSKIEKDTDLATQLENRPIENLKNAISLNDRIWLTKELFNNDTDLFNQKIKQINQVDDIEKAIEIIDEFSWDKEQESTKYFIKLIYRRFV